MDELAQAHIAEWKTVRIWTLTCLTFNRSFEIIGLQNYVHATSAVGDLVQVAKIPISVYCFLYN